MVLFVLGENIMIKKYIVFVCCSLVCATDVLAGLKVNCGATDIYGNVTCNKRCAECAESKCVLAGVACDSGTGPVRPPITFGCAAGEYQDDSSNLIMCKDCPSDTINGATNVTSPGGGIPITSCYIPSGTSFADSTGRGTFTAKCNYTN